MTDVSAQVRRMTVPPASAPADRPDGAAPESVPSDVIDIIELLFFAYRDFISDPDAILAQYGFGRAHHRVLHFVYRNPGLTVADLLDILKITKQSLGRVLKQLVDGHFVVQHPGPKDRRQRRLYATEGGTALARRLSEPQARRVAEALGVLPPRDRCDIADFLFAMLDPAERPKAARLARREAGS